MTAIETGNPRSENSYRMAARRRAAEWAILIATSLAFLFALGLISG
ncbi:hypothetical protein [Devosia sp.]|nr:hypothetical protein [Devosia sp.]MBN9333747.1 hypothetical protein [Devosia sp.]